MPKTMAFGAALHRRPLQRWSIAALLLAAILLVVSALAVNLGLRDLGDNRALVARTTLIQREAADLRTSLRAAETGQRGYLLTGQPRYLATYERALGRIPADYAALAHAVRDPAQIGRLRALRPLIDAKLAELAETVKLRQVSLEAALAVVRTDRGQELTERIDTLLDEFAAAQQALLAKRVAAEERNARYTAAAAVATGLLSLLSAVAGVYLIHQQRAADALTRYNVKLAHQVAERTSRLTEANSELDAFAYTISHDLRAPLRAMHGYADALEEDEGERLSEEGRDFVRAIAAAATRMNALIEDILAYARMAREEVTLRPHALEPIVVRARDEVLAASDKSSDIVIDSPLGAVLAHGPTLQQVVVNLLSNAIKFVGDGQQPIVRVRAERRGDRLCLLFEDNGIGVAPEHREQIFAPFSRLHGVESYPGTGIGLAIVKRGVERMGGTCGVDAAPGGSHFWIELNAAGEQT